MVVIMAGLPTLMNQTWPLGIKIHRDSVSPDVQVGDAVVSSVNYGQIQVAIPPTQSPIDRSLRGRRSALPLLVKSPMDRPRRRSPLPPSNKPLIGRSRRIPV